MAVIHKNRTGREQKIPRVCAYIRVSTQSDTQDGSYEEQERYFTRFIQSSPGMEFVGVYGDHGKSGREMKHRAGMKQLMEDARARKFDLVYCKSVSRWARNLAELVESVRELKGCGVGVIFQRENIDTRDSKNDLILGIFSTIAAQESQSISDNVLWARQKHLEKGEPWEKPRYGYHMEMPGHRWVVTPSEASRVRKAFLMAARGRSYTEIRDALNEMEKTEGTSKVWYYHTVRSMLTALVYTGDYLSDQYITILTPTGKKRVANKGQRDQILIEQHHEPLVSHELFDVIQVMIENKMLYTNRRSFPVCCETLLQRGRRLADEEEKRLIQ